MYSEEFINKVMNTIEEHFDSKIKEVKAGDIGTLSQHAALNLLDARIKYEINRIRQELYKIDKGEMQ